MPFNSKKYILNKNAWTIKTQTIQNNLSLDIKYYFSVRVSKLKIRKTVDNLRKHWNNTVNNKRENCRKYSEIAKKMTKIDVKKNFEILWKFSIINTNSLWEWLIFLILTEKQIM